MYPKFEHRKEVAAAAFIAAAVLLWTGSARAQILPGASPCPPGAPCDVFDLGDGFPDIFAQILQQDTYTATSVTTGLPSLPYTPINPNFYASQQSALYGAGVSNGSFCVDCATEAADFVGWVDYGDNSTVKAHQVVSDMLHTAQAAIGMSSALGATSVDVSAIAQASSSTNNLLTAVQAETAAVLALHDDITLLRGQMAALTLVEAAKMAEDVNTRAQSQAHSGNQFWGMD